MLFDLIASYSKKARKYIIQNGQWVTPYNDSSEDVTSVAHDPFTISYSDGYISFTTVNGIETAYAFIGTSSTDLSKYKTFYCEYSDCSFDVNFQLQLDGFAALKLPFDTSGNKITVSVSGGSFEYVHYGSNFEIYTSILDGATNKTVKIYNVWVE